MALSKPWWLKSWLEWLNVDEGDWLDISIPIPFVSDPHIKVPWFSVNIGDWIETAIDAALDVIDAALDAIRSVSATFQDVYEIGAGILHSVWGLIDAAKSELWGGVNTAVSTLWSRIDTLGAQLVGLFQAAYDYIDNRVAWAVSQAVKQAADLIDDAIGAALDTIRYQINLITEFGDEIQAFFADPGEYILDKLEEALDRFW